MYRSCVLLREGQMVLLQTCTILIALTIKSCSCKTRKVEKRVNPRSLRKQWQKRDKEGGGDDETRSSNHSPVGCDL